MPRNSSDTKKWWALGALLTLALLGLALAAQESTSLAVNGHQGAAKVVQLHDHNYVEVEGLARITNGTISFKGNQIILNLPTAEVAPAAPQAKPALSKDFITAAFEAMARLREWHAALKTAIEKGVPLATGWLDTYQSQAQDALRLAAVSVNTEQDRRSYPLLVSEFNNMKALNDKYVGMTKAMNYIDPTSLASDPLDQKLTACGHSLAALASAQQFIEDGNCQ
jgi:hypothetical protein